MQCVGVFFYGYKIATYNCINFIIYYVCIVLRGCTHTLHSPLTSDGGDAIEPVSWVVLVTVVTHRTQVIVATLCTLPPDAKDGLLSAGVTHGPLMLHTCVGEAHVSELFSSYAIIQVMSWLLEPINDVWRCITIP